MKDEIFKKIAEVISTNNKEIPLEDIHMESSFEQLNMDSLDGITLIADLENHYKIILTNEEVAEIKTVGQAVAAIEKHLSQK